MMHWEVYYITAAEVVPKKCINLNLIMQRLQISLNWVMVYKAPDEYSSSVKVLKNEKTSLEVHVYTPSI
jgi:hypothetical protein